MNTEHILDILYETVQSRKHIKPDISYTASLYGKGRAKIAQKVGEEAVETAIAAVQGDPREIISESADLLFHLWILLADADIKPEAVMQELERRLGMSGLDEKRSRKE